MAFIGGNTDVKNAYYFKVIGLKKGSEEVYFEVKQKDENGDYPVVNKVKGVQGHLESIKLEKRDYQGEEIVTYKFVMKDKEDLYIVSFGNNSVLRSLLNCLASADIVGEIAFGVYINKNGNKSVWVKNDNNSLGWKYKFEDLPEVKVAKVGKKEVYDSTERDEFFESTVLKEVCEKLTPSPEAVKAETNPLDEAINSAQEEDEDMDLPF